MVDDNRTVSLAPNLYTSLNPSQRRHLYEGLVHLERQLASLEAILAPAAAADLFPKYADDLQDEQRRRVQAGVAAARAAIAQTLAANAIAPEPPATGIEQAVRAHLSVLELAAEEMGARSMRGYGELAPEQTEALDRLALTLRQAMTAIWPVTNATHATDATGMPPSSPARPTPEALAALAAALGATTGTVIEAMAQALAAAVGQPDYALNDALPLIAGEVLVQAARATAAPLLGVPAASLPTADIDRIRWRLDAPRWSPLGRDALKSFRRQLEPLRGDIEAALRAYAVRALTVAARPGTPGSQS